MNNLFSRLLRGAAICAALILCTTAQSQTIEPSGTAGTSQIADVPRIISYQGLVRGLDGKSISDGKHNFSITLYSDEQGANIVWTDSYTASTEQGVFSVLLGSGERSLPTGTSLNRPLWVGVRLDGQEEMRPLSQLTSSPFALNVADNSISSTKLQDSAVTADKIGASYVGGIAVNGVPVTSKGTMLNLVGVGNTSIQYDRTSNSILVDGNGTVGEKGGNAQIESANNGINPHILSTQVVINGTSSQYYVPTWTANSAELNLNSTIKEYGGAVTFNSTAGGSTAKVTITSSSGNLTTEGSITTNSTGSSGGYYKIGSSTVLQNYGSFNIFVGALAGNTTTTTSGSTALGFESLYSLSDGLANTAVGAYALTLNDHGGGNTAVGLYAMYYNTAGIGNTGIGTDALQTNGIGSDNTALGYDADVASSNLSNTTALGYGAVASASNAIQLGNGSVTLVNTSGNVTTSGGLTVTAGNAVITGSGSSSGDVALIAKASSNSTPDILNIDDNSGSTVLLKVTNSGNVAIDNSNFFYDNSSHRLGLGTSSPQTLLHVNSASPGSFRYTDTHEGSGKFLVSDASGNATWTIATPSGVNTVSAMPPLQNTGSVSDPVIELTGVVAVPHGGTGQSSLTQYGVVVGEGASAVDVVAAASPAQVLISQSSADPDFKSMTGDVAITSSGATSVNSVQSAAGTSIVSAINASAGTLNVAHGGTGATTLSLNGVLYGNGTSAIQSTGSSTVAGQFLQTTNAGDPPTWKTILAPANGGTGYSSLSAASIPTGTGTTNTMTKWTATNSIGNSSVTDDGTYLQIGGSQFVVTEASGNLATTGTFAASPSANGVITATFAGTSGTGSPDILNVKTSAATTVFAVSSAGNALFGNSSHAGKLVINDGNTYATSISPRTQSANIDYTFPAAQGAAGYYLTLLNGSGDMTWASGSPASPVTVDNATIQGLGTVGNGLYVDLNHANTWLTTVTVAPTANVVALVVKEESSGGPTNDIIDVDSSSGTLKYMNIDNLGNLFVNKNITIGNSATTPDGRGHIHAAGAHCTVAMNANSQGNTPIGTADDIAGLVGFTTCNTCMQPYTTGDQIDIICKATYTGTVVIVVSGYDDRSAACCPYGKYTVAGGVGKITIGIGVPWLPANANAIHQFHYHVIAVQ